MTNFNIKIISDNVCPWAPQCYVRKRRLDKAIALYQKTVPAGKDDTFTLFEEDRDISSKDMLVQAAVKGGLEAGEVRAWLESDQGGAQVDREVQEAYALGVSGVPHFVVDGQQLGGAQDVEAFVEAFANIKEKRA
ncbi:conserved hypothetical protein [Verticillium alfalfae VaMs.102]|uniref:DSBA-like thioredoxin domain-containing protein n=1 Tax=Verticillium alfalfae (strain VaMs.102 / ATCC MYA-4576 / FGSC 10136) TaxID=526221 RepID=C9SGF7_VERA1|nr:conserved hypothetical protein [Verticillium alfalfae VaMs.102]EEY17497.1 conserved hypothetical protein [Verticillium alfalfae VaMs.102]